MYLCIYIYNIWKTLVYNLRLYKLKKIYIKTAVT